MSHDTHASGHGTGEHAGHGTGEHDAHGAEHQVGHGGAGSSHAGMQHEVGVHGMLVAGGDTVFFSHLPMFDHAQHDAQAILEVAFSGDDDPQALYLRDRQQPGWRFYTFAPDEADKFVLADLVTPDLGNPRRRSMRGTLYRGHFERRGRHLVSDRIDVSVTNIVYFRQFDPDAAPLGELTYLLFGKGRELFLAHLITRPPDFDQVVSVSIAGQTISDQDLRQGVRIGIPGRANSIAERLKAGETVEGTLSLAGAEKPITVRLEVLAEHYFEEGELRADPTFDPTDAEIAAGFGDQ